MLSCPNCGSDNVILIAGGCGMSPKVAFYCKACKRAFTGWENARNGKAISVNK
jgi:transposase-like protein